MIEEVYDEDDENVGMYQLCPHCGREYDEIDFEYQICHICHQSAKQ